MAGEDDQEGNYDVEYLTPFFQKSDDIECLTSVFQGRSEDTEHGGELRPDPPGLDAGAANVHAQTRSVGER